MSKALKITDVEWDTPGTKVGKRIINVLNAQGILTLDDLSRLSYDDLRRIWGLGERACLAILRVLFRHGIELQTLPSGSKSFSLIAADWKRLDKPNPKQSA
jgi:hypothetical protein